MTCREFANSFLETVKADPCEELQKTYSQNMALVTKSFILSICMHACIFILIEKILYESGQRSKAEYVWYI